jgi:hypothetical protein
MAAQTFLSGHQMAGVGQKTSGFQDYEIKKTQVFPVVADIFSGKGDSKKKGG